jgi:hypothetical protein
MAIWYTGEIRKKKTDIIRNYHIVNLDITHLERILQLQEEIYQGIEDKETFVKSEREEFEKFFNENDGNVLGFCVEDEGLVGYRINSFNQENINYYKNLLNLDDSRKMLYFDATIIRSDYRGNHLQRKAIRISLHYAMKNPDFRYAFSTVSPKNIPSMKSLLYNRVHIVKAKNIYGGKDRFIALYDRDSRVHRKRNRIYVPVKDFKSVSEKLSEGYVGIHIKGTKDEYLLEMVR